MGTLELSEGYFNVKDDTHVDKFIRQSESESDRSVVLISAAFIDSLLEDKLKLIFGKGNSLSREKLFSVTGPFGSLSSKTEALYCAGKIPKNAYDDINIVRKIRNVCAHQWVDFSFIGDIDNNFISKLKNTLFFESYLSENNLPPIHPRSKFTLTVCALILILNIDKQHA